MIGPAEDRVQGALHCPWRVCQGGFQSGVAPGAASGEKAPSRLDHRLARSAPELKRIRAGPTGCVRLRWRVRDRLNEPLPARRGCSGIGNHSGLMMASLCEKFDVQHKHPPNAGTAPATGTTGVPCCTGTTWRRSPSGGYEGAASNDPKLQRAVTTTVPGSARACARAATLGTSPKISLVASTTTGPRSMATRAAMPSLMSVRGHPRLLSALQPLPLFTPFSDIVAAPR